MKKLIYLIIIIVIIVFGWRLLFDNEINIALINQAVADGEAILLDVRTSEERTADGYALSSTHFNLSRLEAGELPGFDKNIVVYTYCKGGARAGQAKDILEENGFTNVINIGGLTDWEEAGGSVVR